MHDLDPWRRLNTCLISDTLDQQFGRPDLIMDHRVAFRTGSRSLIGRARTGRLEPLRSPEDRGSLNARLIELVDGLEAGDVPLLAFGWPALPLQTCVWGDILSLAAQLRGAAGLVTDGFIRDLKEIERLGFATVSAGIWAADANGRATMKSLGGPVDCGGVRVNDGDLVFADSDGCIVIPQAIEGKVLAAAVAKLDAEAETIALVGSGRSLASVFGEIGVL